MNKKLAVVVALCALPTLASARAAKTARPANHPTAGGNLARMNLRPTNIRALEVPRREFARDTIPTSFHYALPTRGAGAVFGYKPFVDTHPIQGYEVNQATAEGFRQPSSSVGAALAYRF